MKNSSVGSFDNLPKMAMNWARPFSAALVLCGLAMIMSPAPARAAIGLADAVVGVTNESID